MLSQVEWMRLSVRAIRSNCSGWLIDTIRADWSTQKWGVQLASIYQWLYSIDMSGLFLWLIKFSLPIVEYFTKESSSITKIQEWLEALDKSVYLNLKANIRMFYSTDLNMGTKLLVSQTGQCFETWISTKLKSTLPRYSTSNLKREQTRLS